MIDQKKTGRRASSEIATRFSLESDWLRKNGSRFAGQWVALVGSEFVDSGPDGVAIYKQAKGRTSETPTLLFVESANNLPFGGW